MLDRHLGFRLITWFGICVTYIRFYKGFKAQGLDRSTLPFASKLNPYAAYYGAFWTLFICFFSGWNVFLKGKWDHEAFVTNYFPLILFPILYFGARYFNKEPMKSVQDMDFITGVKEAEDDS